MPTEMSIRELYQLAKDGTTLELDQLDFVQLQGWVRTNRAGKNVSFIALNDGTFFKNAQIVYSSDTLSNYAEVAKYLTGTAISVVGKFVLTPEASQPFEIQATEINLEGECDSTYPLQKKRHTFEYLREIGHLRPRTNTFSAVFRVRSVLAMAIHQFFQDQGFVYVHTPIITGADAEGAGETFTVTTREDGNYEEDFFGKHASLTVSGQLQAEAYAMAFRDIYTFGPTFRAENSNTTTHAAEFWMIEPEVAFLEIEENMDLAEDFIKHCVRWALERCADDIAFLAEHYDKELVERLKFVLDKPFKRLTYTEGIEILEAAVKAGRKFEFPIYWGADMSSEHERYLVEEHFKTPVIVTDYPKEIKSFYMKLNEDGKTVRGMDVLFPKIGEIIGGSEREADYDKLKARAEEMGVPDKDIWWYMDTRRYGTAPHSGFGLGFERLLLFVTGMTNIRDVIPFPRTPRNADF